MRVFFYGYSRFQSDKNLSRYLFSDRDDNNIIYMYHLNATYCQFPMNEPIKNEGSSIFTSTVSLSYFLVITNKAKLHQVNVGEKYLVHI